MPFEPQFKRHYDAARDNLTIISAINQIKYFTHTETKLQKVW